MAATRDEVVRALATVLIESGESPAGGYDYDPAENIYRCRLSSGNTLNVRGEAVTHLIQQERLKGGG